MTKYEIKKVFSKKSNKIAIFLLFLALGTTCYFAADVSYVDETGCTQNGYQAVQKLKNSQQQWSGYLDEDKIQMVIAENLRIRNSPEALSQNVNKNSIAYGWGQGIQDIRNLLNCSYADEFREYDYYKADSLIERDAKDFYSNRITLLKEWLSGEAKYQFSIEEKNYLIKQYKDLKTPLYYDYLRGWKQLFEFAPTIVMLTMLILGYIVSGIFSNEFAWKSDAIFFSSFHGRNKGVTAKIKAGFLIVTTIYFVTFILYTVIVLSYLGTNGWNLSIQSNWNSWKCFYNISNLQKYFLIAIGGYIGCLFISLLCMFVSAKTKSSVFAVMFPFVIVFFPSFLSNLNSATVNKIIGLLPDQLLQIGTALNYFNLYSICGKIFGEVPILFIVYSVLVVVCIPILYQTYRHTQVS